MVRKDPSCWLRLTAGLALMIGAPPAWGSVVSSPAVASQGESVAADVLSFGTDPNMRMTVAVNIGGKGPFPFIIDTGAQRTVIARELAERLGLDHGQITEIHSMSGAKSVRTVVIPSLEVNRRTVRDIIAPALAQENLGAAGILGLDTLQSQRVLLDFKAATMTVTPSTERQEKWNGEEIVVRAKSRFGQLVLADASVDGERVYVIIDTGAQVSVGNEALRRKLFGSKKPRDWHQIQLVSVTGGMTVANYTTANRLRIAGLHISNLPIAFADAHPFLKLDLRKKPALLLGMDALRLFDRVSVDFANRKVKFLKPDGAARAAVTQTAEAEIARPAM